MISDIFWGLRDTIAGVSILIGLSGFILVTTGDVQFADEFAIYAGLLGVYAELFYVFRADSDSLKTRLSITPIFGVVALLIPPKIALLIVSLLLVTGGIALSLSND